MKLLLLGLLSAIATSMAVGCAPRGLKAYGKYNLGAAEPIVASAIESSGGLAAWRKLGQVRAVALMTVYDRKDQAYLNRQEHKIDMNRGRLSIEAITAKGTWRATYRRGGGFSLTGSDALEGMTPSQLRQAMRILLHRLSGPMNLLRKSETPGHVEHLTLDGKDLVKVSVTGPQPRPTAYYFDSKGGGLQMVSDGPEQPSQGGTVTIYSYQILPGGLVFPKKLTVVRTGDHVLVGRSKVMEVQYSDVQVN